MKTLKTALKHIRRSPYQALAAVMVVSLTFFVFSVLILFLAGSEKVLKFFETRPQITAFFEDGMEPKAVENLKAVLQGTGKIKNLKYVSKDEALVIYKELNKKDPLLLEMVTAEILPASLEVAATDINYLPELASILKETKGIEDVVFQEDVVKNLTSWSATIRKIGLGLIAFLFTISILILIIIIGMKMATKSGEIRILRLLGASYWYTSGPFLLEGIIYGIAGAILGWGAAYISLLYATPFLVSFLANIELLPIPIWFMLALVGGEILMGALIGILSSFIAVRRFLK